jgi:hypothetical protein
MYLSSTVVALVLVGLCVGAMSARAQDEDDALFGDVPLENAIAGHNLAVRIRGEVLFSEDDESLLDDDVAYEQFPREIYSAEVRVFQTDGLSIAGSHSRWNNDQGLDTQRSGMTVRVPWGAKTKLTWSYRHLSKESDDPDRDYLYIGVSRRFGERLYSYTQYRNTAADGSADVHQLSQYASWTAARRYRVGGKGAISIDGEDSKAAAWYVDAFASAYIWKDRTSLRLSHRYYDTGEALNFDETKLYLYYRPLTRMLLRADYRFYRDSGNMESHAYGAKIKYYSSVRTAVHVGYRFYDHKTGVDLDSLFAGFSVLL